MIRAAAALAALCLGLAVPEAAAKDRRHESLGTVAGWTLLATHFESKPVFKRCIVTRGISQRPERRMTFVLGRDGGFSLLLEDEGWRLGADQTFPIELQVDEYARRGASFRSAKGAAGLIHLPEANALMAELQRGHELYILTSRTTLAYPLRGTARALEALKRCWQERTRPARSAERNPFTGDEAARTRRAAPRREASGTYGANFAGRTARQVVAQLHDQGFRGWDRPPDDLNGPDVHYYWRMDGGFGVARLLDGRFSLEEVRQSAEEEFGASCDGHVGIDAQEIVLRGDFHIRTVQAACTRLRSGKPLYAVISYYTTSTGRMVRIFHGARDSLTAVQADKAFRGEIHDMFLDG